jgi:hypothetical protein
MDQAGAEIKTENVLISEEYQEKVNRFIERLAVLSRRNRTLARLVFLHACCFGVFTEDMPDAKAFQPKRGRKQEITFPIKEVMDILKISHRQAQAYHQAGLLMETVDMLFDEKVEWVKNSIGKGV